MPIISHEKDMNPIENDSTICKSNYIELKNKIKNLSIQRWGEKNVIEIIGEDNNFIDCIRQVEKISNAQRPILIHGESGSGKEILAKSIYLLSKRNGRPFNIVNCAQFCDDNLIISELFGHKKGSFTGAEAEHHGVFETANSGTVFLDEIGELSLKVQSMLLRVIEQKEIRPLGASQPISIDLHFIMATHKDMHDMVREKKFRDDLYHRLCCHQIHLPPLRMRVNDMELLAKYFLSILNNEHGVKKALSEQSLAFLRAYRFPGNIRELQNIVERGWWNSEGIEIHLKDFEPFITLEHSEEKKKDESMRLFNRITIDKINFWEVIRIPYLGYLLDAGNLLFRFLTPNSFFNHVICHRIYINRIF